MEQPEILKYFAYAHLPPHLRKVSSNFMDLATYVIRELPDCAERSVALRKLLEAKDAAVRAALEEPKKEPEPGTCSLCGKPMPPGEEMFKYHGYSGPCPE